VKIERDSVVNALVAVMKNLLKAEFFSACWKGVRTILISKGGYRDNPENCRSITITIVLYILIFCRIADVLHTVLEKERVGTCDPEQKRFFPRNGSCVEHAAVANGMIMRQSKKGNQYIFCRRI
jgi:hypothetical protein